MYVVVCARAKTGQQWLVKFPVTAIHTVMWDTQQCIKVSLIVMYNLRHMNGAVRT